MGYTEARYVIFFIFFFAIVLYFTAISDLSGFVEVKTPVDNITAYLLEPTDFSGWNILSGIGSFTNKVITMLTLSFSSPQLLILNFFLIAMGVAFILVLFATFLP